MRPKYHLGIYYSLLRGVGNDCICRIEERALERSIERRMARIAESLHLASGHVFEICDQRGEGSKVSHVYLREVFIEMVTSI